MLLNDKLKAIVLAAGKGTRLRSEGIDLPKVMRIAAGKPLLSYVLSALSFISPNDCVVVVGYMKERVTEAFKGYVFAEQSEQLGTGHAVVAALREIEDYDGALLVCCGDMPLIKRDTYIALIDTHMASNNVCTILSGYSEIDLPYGRILRDGNGDFCGLVEDRDATPEQKQINELNSGVYVFDAASLKSVLQELKRDNSQGEYYLTDAPMLLMERGLTVGVCKLNLGYQIIGVNTNDQLNQIEEIIIKNE